VLWATRPTVEFGAFYARPSPPTHQRARVGLAAAVRQLMSPRWSCAQQAARVGLGAIRLVRHCEAGKGLAAGTSFTDHNGVHVRETTRQVIREGIRTPRSRP